jgi:hypothetical protein
LHRHCLEKSFNAIVRLSDRDHQHPYGAAAAFRQTVECRQFLAARFAPSGEEVDDDDVTALGVKRQPMPLGIGQYKGGWANGYWLQLGSLGRDRPYESAGGENQRRDQASSN